MGFGKSFYGKILGRLVLNALLVGMLAALIFPELLRAVDWRGFFESGRGPGFVGLGVIVSMLLWYSFARQVGGAVRSMTALAEQIAEGSFAARADSARSDELGELGTGINRMAVRLEGYVNGQKRFLGDTAHELCSPLARMQMAVGILEGKVAPEAQPYVVDIEDEVRHMSELVGELLSFSKASLRPGEVRLQPVLLAPIVAAAIRRDAATGQDVRMDVPGEIEVCANTQLLSRAIGNLLRNAIRYAGQCGPIGVKAEVRDEHVYIVIWDNGPGIAAAHIDQIFDPFYRPDTSRTSATGGVGLGMAIVKTCIEGCGGKVICKPRKSGGLKVVIRLGIGPATTSRIGAPMELDSTART